MGGKKFSLRLCPETEAILANVSRERRSEYVRQAILFYHNQGAVLRRIEEKLDLVMEGLGEGFTLPGPPERKQGTIGGEPAIEAYLFSGQEEIFNI
ncbi:MAG: hypothetical protein D9V47_10100 [Clostridia bacterium]|nr:MAG: hypothetical protein D9V47_10100 [Clostridia bacterium]